MPYISGVALSQSLLMKSASDALANKSSSSWIELDSKISNSSVSDKTDAKFNSLSSANRSSNVSSTTDLFSSSGSRLASAIVAF